MTDMPQTDMTRSSDTTQTQPLPCYATPSQKPLDIKLWNFPWWVLETVKASRWFYQRKKRPITISRLRGLLRPNLREPIFVIGAARSGTTFLGDCLGTLPGISYHYEPVLTKAGSRYVYEGRWTYQQSERFYRSVYAWLMRLHFDGDLRFAEKTPRNSNVVGFLADVFPDAKFIHIYRDGRDAALSLSKKPWFTKEGTKKLQYEPGGYPMGPYAHYWVEPERSAEFEATSDFHRCIWAWRRLTEVALDWGEKLEPERYHELRYESLVDNPSHEADRIIKFMRREDTASRDALHTAVKQSRSDSVGAWSRELTETQVADAEHEAGQLLRRLGYLT